MSDKYAATANINRKEAVGPRFIVGSPLAGARLDASLVASYTQDKDALSCSFVRLFACLPGW